METRCFEVEQAADVLGLPADHPDRRHADTCPRCRTLIDSYRSFLKADSLPGSEIERARRVLDAGIRDAAARWVPKSPRPRRSTHPWWRALLRPVPALAIVAAFTIVAVLVTSRDPEESMLREDAMQARSISLHEAEVGAEGSIRLSWSPLAGADRYHVRVYGPDLNEVYRTGAVVETSVVVDRRAVAGGLRHSLDLTWRVYAMSEGDIVEVSEPGSVRVP